MLPGCSSFAVQHLGKLLADLDLNQADDHHGKALLCGCLQHLCSLLLQHCSVLPFGQLQMQCTCCNSMSRYKLAVGQYAACTLVNTWLLVGEGLSAHIEACSTEAGNSLLEQLAHQVEADLVKQELRHQIGHIALAQCQTCCSPVVPGTCCG